MIFNNHSKLKSKHAFLSPSSYHWIRYDEDKLVEKYTRHRAAARGTELHDLASKCINLGINLMDTEDIISLYVNDCISKKMISEQPLYYSENCFGTVDAISFVNNKLKIFDLKTGESLASMDQLMVYAALFCLEYKIKPKDITIELRIYQKPEVVVHFPELDEIVPIMDKIVWFDKLLLKMGKDKEDLTNE